MRNLTDGPLGLVSAPEQREEGTSARSKYPQDHPRDRIVVVPSTRDQPGHDCLNSLLGEGFDNFEISIPFGDDRPYKLVLWIIGQTSYANIEDVDNDDDVMAHGEGCTPAEALWNVTLVEGGNGDPYDPAEPVDYAARLISIAAYLWLKATEKAADEAFTNATFAALRAKEATDVFDEATRHYGVILDRYDIANW